MNPLDQPTPALAPTPRTEEAYFANGATMYSLAGEMKLLERELAAAQAECLEQARLLGISGSREASLIARAERAEAALATERKRVVDEITEKNAPEIAKVNAHIADMAAKLNFNK